VIEVHTASFQAVRGYTLIGAVCDEIAFWRAEDSANPDTEILNGLRPGMATVSGAMLLCISSPYARRRAGGVCDAPRCWASWASTTWAGGPYRKPVGREPALSGSIGKDPEAMTWEVITLQVRTQEERWRASRCLPVNQVGAR